MNSLRLGALGHSSIWRLSLAAASMAVAVACGGTHEMQPSQIQQQDIGYPIREFRDSEAASRRWVDFRQIDRQSFTDEFHAADYRQPNTDQYVEGRNPPPLDILMVVDNSASMEEAQHTLAQGLNPLLSQIQNTDWQIYVVTTDTSCPGTLIRRGDPNLQAAFTAAVTVGSNGDPTERGFKQAHDAIANACNGQNWMRPNSRLSILFVTNEDNCSLDGVDCRGEAWDNANAFMTYLQGVRPAATDGTKNLRVYGIFFHPTQPDCQAGTFRANQYSDIVSRTDGTWESICDADYSPILTRMSYDARMLSAPSFPLTQTPRNNQIEVTIDGQVQPPSAYQLQGRNVVLTNIIFNGQDVRASYIYDQPYSKDFRLNQPGFPDTIRVETNGATLSAAPQTFSYTEANQTISMVPDLDPNQVLRVTYRQNIPLRHTFFVGPVADPSQIHCYLNSGPEILGGLTYDPVAQTVTLVTPPTEMQLFKCQL